MDILVTIPRAPTWASRAHPCAMGGPQAADILIPKTRVWEPSLFIQRTHKYYHILYKHWRKWKKCHNCTFLPLLCLFSFFNQEFTSFIDFLPVSRSVCMRVWCRDGGKAENTCPSVKLPRSLSCMFSQCSVLPLFLCLLGMPLHLTLSTSHLIFALSGLLFIASSANCNSAPVFFVYQGLFPWIALI